jgi:hypothetical protein
MKDTWIQQHGATCQFFNEKGPRSRRYGRTAALRLLVQPYDEDEDDYFSVLYK